MSILITVGVCVRNSEKSVGDALDSILKQNFPHEKIKLVIVDDGSTDRTPLIIKAFAESIDIKTHYVLKGWNGISFSRQIVVENAEGNYIVWVDDDMELHEDCLKEHLDFMEKNPCVGAARGKRISKDNMKLVAALEFIDSMMLKEGPETIGAGGSIYRVNVIKQVNGFDTKIKGAGEDIDITRRMRLSEWRLSSTSAKYYHRSVNSWKDLWDRYFWYGYSKRYISSKNRYNKHLKPLVFLGELKGCFNHYKNMRYNKVLMLPFYYIYKNIAWLSGFIKERVDQLRKV